MLIIIEPIGCELFTSRLTLMLSNWIEELLLRFLSLTARSASLN